MGLYQHEFSKVPLILLFIGGLFAISLATRSVTSRDPAALHPPLKEVAPEQVLENFIKLSFHIKDQEGIPVLTEMTAGKARSEFEAMTYDGFKAFFQDRILDFMEFKVTNLYKLDATTLFVECRIGFVDQTPGTSDVRYLNRNRAKLVLTGKQWKVADVEFLDSLADFLQGRKVHVLK